jgi:hypothetical protein
MTESTASSATSASKQPSFWEDLLDIYFSPADVFRRQQNQSVWPPMLFVAVAAGLIFFFTYNTLQPIFEAEFMKSVQQQARGAELTAEQLAAPRKFAEMIARFGIGPIMLVTMFVLGVVSWIVGKVVGAKQTFHVALAVAAWAFMPRVLAFVLSGVQGLLLDTSTMTSQLSLSIGPARFFDPETTNPVLFQLLGRFDLFTLWVTVLLAVGLYVTGKVSKGNAAAFGVIMWILGSIPVLRAGFLAS